MAPTQVAAAAALQMAIGYEGPRKKLLVVDDVPENRAMLVDMLRPLDFLLIEAEDGRQGLERAQALQPDAILMDNVMPVMDGLEAMRRLRALPAFRDAPIIAISASAAKTDEANALAAGASAFLSKPLREPELFALLERHLGIRFIYREQFVPKAVPLFDPAALTSLPAACRADLARALTRLDSEAIRRSIADIQTHDAALGRALASLADEFRYDQMLRWILGSKAESGTGA